MVSLVKRFPHVVAVVVHHAVWIRHALQVPHVVVAVARRPRVVFRYRRQPVQRIIRVIDRDRSGDLQQVSGFVKSVR